MIKIFKKAFSVILCLTLVFSSVASAVAAATSSYPDGITEEQSANALEGTDNLLTNAVPDLTGQSLTTLVTSMLYTDATVSTLLVGIYSSFEDGEMDLSYLGIDTSVSSVASSLAAYPQVSSSLAQYESWADVEVEALAWGVTDRESFATAVSHCFSKLNPFLYTLLCSGNMKIGSLINIQGADGYENAVVPILEALGCRDMISQANFSFQAQRDRNTMVKNILLPVLVMLEESLVAPVDSFSGTLPSFAEFTVSGKLNEYIGILLSPITNNTLVNAMITLGLFDAEMDAQSMINDMLSGSAGEGFKLAPLDFEALASCGTGSGDTFVPDKSMAYVEIMRWLVESLKLNADGLASLMGGEEGDTSLSDMLNGEDTDNIVSTIIMLFTPQELLPPQVMDYPSITPMSVTYTPNLSEADYLRALGEIDPLLDAFVREGGTAETIGQVLSSAIYNNDNVTSLVKGVYGALEESGMTPLLALLGIDVSPKGVARYLTAGSQRSAAAQLSGLTSWSQVTPGSISWGVSTGSRAGFQNALTAVLKPMAPALRMLLAGYDMEIYDSAVISGADGYNTAVIPLLEALGCNPDDIKSYSSYKLSAYGDGVIKNLLDPIFNLIDEICATPVSALVKRLPNIIYFLDSGALNVCINNLMRPLTSLTKNLTSMSFDMSALTSELDIEALVSGLVDGLGMETAELDIKSFANMGTAVTRTSKSVIDGQNLTYTYIEADEAGIFLTLLRFLAETMRIPGNENLLMSTMSSEDMGSFSSYTDTLTEQISVMNTDELVEWLFNLFFKERIEVEVVVPEQYVPDITYQEPEKDYTAVIILCVVLGVAAISGGAVVVVRSVKKKRLDD